MAWRHRQDATLRPRRAKTIAKLELVHHVRSAFTGMGMGRPMPINALRSTSFHSQRANQRASRARQRRNEFSSFCLTTSCGGGYTRAGFKGAAATSWREKNWLSPIPQLGALNLSAESVEFSIGQQSLLHSARFPPALGRLRRVPTPFRPCLRNYLRRSVPCREVTFPTKIASNA